MLRLTLGLLALASLLTSFVGCVHQTTEVKEQKSPLGEAVVLLLSNQHEDALALCDQVLAQNPDDFNATMLRGEICEAVGDIDGAIVAYEKGTDLQPHANQPHRLLADLRRDQLHEDSSETKIESDNTATAEVALVRSEPGYGIEVSHNDTSQVGELLDGTDKSYRDPPASRAQSMPRSRPRAQVAAHPQNPLVARLRQAIAEGQRLDALANQKIPHEAPQRLSDPEQPMPEQAAPVQVTRFDFGLGMGTTPIVFDQARTTGRRSMMTTAIARRDFASSASRIRSARVDVDHCQKSRSSSMAACFKSF